MKILTIKRVCMTELGTFGVLMEEGPPQYPFCLTLELPWKGNLPEVSCIPRGEYLCKKVDSPKYGRVFEVQDVPNRTHILIHKANWTSDLRGCVGLGDTFDQTLNPKLNRVETSVMASGVAYTEFFNKILHMQEEFKLVILEC